MILGCTNVIASTLFGEYLIKSFKLGEKFPNLAKYIKLRQTNNKNYLILSIVMIYLVIIIYLAVNLYMFTTGILY